MENDGNVGGKPYIGKRGILISLGAAMNEVRFTILPLTNSDGEPVCCVVIFQSENLDEIKAFWKTGIDVMADAPSLGSNNSNFVDHASGVGGMLPSGPKCTTDGVDIPCFVTSSPHGGIFSQILADILCYLDALNVFPHNKGPAPTLILDRHNSWFELPILEYSLKTPNFPWHACIGVPYGQYAYLAIWRFY